MHTLPTLLTLAAAALLPLAVAEDAAATTPIPAPARCIQPRPLLLPDDAVCVQKDGEHGFSRAPKAPYITDMGVMVQEHLVPPKFRGRRVNGKLVPNSGGPWAFRVVVSRLSADGRSLHTTSYRLYNSAPEGTRPTLGDVHNSWHEIRLYETDTPFVFRIGRRVLRFTPGGGKDEDGIKSCEYCDLDEKGRPTTPFRPYCPTPHFRTLRADEMGPYGG